MAKDRDKLAKVLLAAECRADGSNEYVTIVTEVGCIAVPIQAYRAILTALTYPREGAEPLAIELRQSADATSEAANGHWTTTPGLALGLAKLARKAADFIEAAPTHPREEIGEEAAKEIIETCRQRAIVLFQTYVRGVTELYQRSKDQYTFDLASFAEELGDAYAPIIADIPPSSPPEDANAPDMDALVETALHARVPGGAEVRAWLPMADDAETSLPVARNVMRAALEVVASSLNRVSIADEICRFIDEDEGDAIYEKYVDNEISFNTACKQIVRAALSSTPTPTIGHCPLHGSYPVAPSRCPTCKKAGRPPTPEELQAWGVVPDSTPTSIDGEPTLPCPCVVHERYVPTCPEHGTPKVTPKTIEQAAIEQAARLAANGNRAALPEDDGKLIDVLRSDAGALSAAARRAEADSGGIAAFTFEASKIALDLRKAATRIEAYAAKVETLSREIERLRDLLDCYGGHTGGCRVAVRMGEPCYCGWKAAQGFLTTGSAAGQDTP